MAATTLRSDGFGAPQLAPIAGSSARPWSPRLRAYGETAAAFPLCAATVTRNELHRMAAGRRRELPARFTTRKEEA